MPSRWDTVSVNGNPMRCYVSSPEGTGPFAAVVVIQHAGGVDDFIQSMTDRFSAERYVGIAPDLYHREDAKASDDPLTRMGRLRDKNIVPDVNATIGHLQTLSEAQADCIGITGFCMGGRVTYLMAARNPALRSAVVFYGGNIFVPWGEGPPPFELSRRISCPVLGLFGEDDPNPNSADVARLDAELTRLGKTHEFHSYSGAGHAFMNTGRPSFREETAKDAWQKCLGWFDRYLKA